MIYPTRRCVVAALAGAPIALVVGLIQPGLWLAAPAWMLAVATLMLLDALLAPWPKACRITFEAPGYLAVAAPAQARLEVALGKRGRRNGVIGAHHQRALAGLSGESGEGRVKAACLRARRPQQDKLHMGAEPDVRLVGAKWGRQGRERCQSLANRLRESRIAWVVHNDRRRHARTSDPFESSLKRAHVASFKRLFSKASTKQRAALGNNFSA